MLNYLFTCSVSALLLCTATNAQPANWFKDTKGLMLDSAEQLDTLMETFPEKFVVVDFYMEQCHWCFQFQAEWN